MNKLFASVGAVLAASALALSAPTAKAQDVTLKLAHVAPPTSSFQVAAESYAAHLRDLSGGTMDLDIVPGGALGSLPELWAQLRAGTLDMHLIDVGAILAIKETKQFFIIFAPYLFRDQDHWRDFVHGDIFGDMMAKAEADTGIKYLGYIKDRAPRALSTAGKAVRTPEDIKGMKIRTPLVPAITNTFEAWGANPTPVKASELYTAMQTGLVDGQDNGIIDVVAAGYTEVQDYFTPLDYLYSGIGIWMSGSKFESLTDEQKSWALKAADLAFEEQKDGFAKEMEEAFAAAREKGMEIVEPDIEAFREASRPIVDGFDGKAWPAGLYDEIHGMK